MNGQDVKQIVDRLDKLKDGQGQLETQFAELKGIVLTTQERHATEIGVLFEKHSDHGKRINAIERNYVPKGDCQSQHAGVQKEHREFRAAIDEQRSSTAKIFGAAAVIAVIAGLVVAMVVKLVG